MNLNSFTAAQFEELFDNIIAQKISSQDVKKILLEINEIGFTTNVFVGAASALKKCMTKINAPKNAIDVCGTGGDKLNTLNISTATCFVLAGVGLTVAKHGNKAISSKSGSADIFAELRIEILSDISKIEKTLQEQKLCFLFAPFFHQSLKNLAEIRKEIAQEFNAPTIFNYLGPILNPANIATQLIGTSKKETMLPIVEALKIMGSKHVYVVHGFDKMDEITLCDNSYLLKLEGEKISEEIIDPQNYGFSKVALEALRGQDPQYNASELLALLHQKKSPYRDIVLLNSAFALRLAGDVETIEQGVIKAAKSIDEGRALNVLLQLQQASFVE